MKFKVFFNALPKPEQVAYASRAGTTVSYLRNHLIPGRKVPRRKLIEGLVKASRGMVTYQEVIEHFYYKDK